MALVEQAFLSARGVAPIALLRGRRSVIVGLRADRNVGPTGFSAFAKFALTTLEHYDERGSALPGELLLGTEVRNDEDRASND